MSRSFFVVIPFLAACSSIDPALLDGGGQPIADKPPAPYRVAILPVEFESGEPTADLRLAYDPSELRDRLVAHLRDLRTATEVFVATDLDGARANGADLALTPVLRGERSFVHEGMSSNWLAGGTFWMLTWIGGLFVEDTTYKAEFDLACDIAGAHVAELGGKRLQSSPIDCAYSERISFPSLRFLECLVIPPFWTSDDAEVTSSSLSERATRNLAGHLSLFLKQDFESTIPSHGRLRMLHPADNDGDYSGDVRFELVTEEPIATLSLYLDHARVPLAEEAWQKDSSLIASMVHTTVTIPERSLPAGSCVLRIDSEGKAGQMTRTIRLRREQPTR